MVFAIERAVAHRPAGRRLCPAIASPQNIRIRRYIPRASADDVVNVTHSSNSVDIPEDSNKQPEPPVANEPEVPEEVLFEGSGSKVELLISVLLGATLIYLVRFTCNVLVLVVVVCRDRHAVPFRVASHCDPHATLPSHLQEPNISQTSVRFENAATNSPSYGLFAPSEKVLSWKYRFKNKTIGHNATTRVGPHSHPLRPRTDFNPAASTVWRIHDLISIKYPEMSICCVLVRATCTTAVHYSLGARLTSQTPGGLCLGSSIRAKLMKLRACDITTQFICALGREN